MQQSTASPRTASITIDDIISVFRIATQHQYNARELDTTVSLISFFENYIRLFFFKNATIELHVTNLFGQDFDYQVYLQSHLFFCKCFFLYHIVNFKY
jgi:hypothetical protein